MTVRQLLHRHFIERFQREEMTQAVSSTAIEQIASTLNVLHPASYRDFLETYGPVYTPDILDLIVLRNARLADIQQFQSLEDVIDSSQSIEAKGCLALATDCSGNLFCFKSLSKTLPAPDDAPVWLFDHETGKASKVAKSFDAWLSQYTNLQPLRQDRTSKTSTTPPDHQYQIVLQFPESFFADTPAILAFEENSPPACRGRKLMMAMTPAAEPQISLFTRTPRMPLWQTFASTSARTKSRRKSVLRTAA